MERERRFQIRDVVKRCRRLLEADLDTELRRFGLMADGRILDLGQLPHLTEVDRERRLALEEAIQKEQAPGLTLQEARRRYLQEVAFTVFNRLAGLRAFEVRGFIRETVIRRPKYGGQSLRERDIAEANPGLSPDDVLVEAYRQGCGELSEQIALLFDLSDEYSLILPSPRALRDVMAALSEEISEEDFKEDAILGWIYQYWNEEAREEYKRSKKRRPDPDDIPVINQFYTPRWIVKFLVDNTLGRLWLEQHPNSFLKAFCTYLVPLPEGTRPKPREPMSVRSLKLLDPACGSAHFLLYAFDLFAQMWQEECPNIPAWQIPMLILEHNLHGIDIDLRAVQIGALALYLKARAAYEEAKAQDPQAGPFRITRMNLVCADIRLPNSDRRLKLLRRFEADPALKQIVVRTLTDFEHAFEIGSLLRIRKPFQQLFEQRKVKPELFKERAKQLTLLDLDQQLTLADTPFTPPKAWTVEELVEEIKRFEREAAEVQDMGTLLFGGEAEKAVRLVDLLTDQYDVVVMNPPYGDMPERTKMYLKEHYPKTHFDYYAAFMEQAVDLTKPGGFIGALTGRTFMFLKSYQWIREELLKTQARPEAVLDLGFRVLDVATARWAAWTARKADGPIPLDRPITFFRLTDVQEEEKRRQLLEEALAELAEARR